MSNLKTCPFCGSSTYIILTDECRKCGGEIKSRMFCPHCRDSHTFTVLRGKLGCWNCHKVYNSWVEYENYDATRGGITPLPPPPAPPTNICPICNQPLAFIQQYNRWYCSNCKQYR